MDADEDVCVADDLELVDEGVGGEVDGGDVDVEVCGAEVDEVGGEVVQLACGLAVDDGHA